MINILTKSNRNVRLINTTTTLAIYNNNSICIRSISTFNNKDNNNSSNSIKIQKSRSITYLNKCNSNNNGLNYIVRDYSIISYIKSLFIKDNKIDIIRSKFKSNQIKEGNQLLSDYLKEIVKKPNGEEFVEEFQLLMELGQAGLVNTKTLNIYLQFYLELGIETYFFNMIYNFKRYRVEMDIETFDIITQGYIRYTSFKIYDIHRTDAIQHILEYLAIDQKYDNLFKRFVSDERCITKYFSSLVVYNQLKTTQTHSEIYQRLSDILKNDISAIPQSKVIEKICMAYLTLNRYDMVISWFSRLIYEFKREPSLWLLSFLDHHFQQRVSEMPNQINSDYSYYFRGFRLCYMRSQFRESSIKFFDHFLLDVNQQNVQLTLQLRQQNLETEQNKYKLTQKSQMPTNEKKRQLNQIDKNIRALQAIISTQTEERAIGTTVNGESTAEEVEDEAVDEEANNDEEPNDELATPVLGTINAESNKINPKYISIKNVPTLKRLYPTPEMLFPDTPIIHYIIHLNKTKLIDKRNPIYIRALASNPYFYGGLLRTNLEEALKIIIENMDVTSYYTTSWYVHEGIIMGLFNLGRKDLAERLLRHYFKSNLMNLPSQNKHIQYRGSKLLDELILYIVKSPEEAGQQKRWFKLLTDNIHPDHMPEYINAIIQLEINNKVDEATKIFESVYFRPRIPRVGTMVGTMVFIRNNQDNWFKTPKLSDLFQYLNNKYNITGKMPDAQLVYHDIFMTLQYMGAKELTSFTQEYLSQLRQDGKRAIEILDDFACLLISIQPNEAVETFELLKPNVITNESALQVLKNDCEQKVVSKDTLKLIDTMRVSEDVVKTPLSGESILYINTLLNTNIGGPNNTNLSFDEPDSSNNKETL